MNSFEGKIAIVTGAAQGIGSAIALRMARGGAKVALVDRASEACKPLLERIIGEGGEAIIIGADLETKAGADAMIDQSLARFGAIDIAVNNVGGAIHIKPFWEFTDEEIQAEVARSLWPTLRCCRAVIPVMLKQQRGTIINIGSMATREIYRVPYSASKGGVHAMTVCMAMELAPHGIRVNCVAPGGIEQSERIIPRSHVALSQSDLRWRDEVRIKNQQGAYLPRRGTADEVAASVAFFASDDAAHITGEIMYVAGGRIG